MTVTRVLRVQAADSRSGSQETIFELSDMDHLMPKLYVHMIEVFELRSDANRDRIVDNLAKGLANALRDYPVMTGTLHLDNDAKRIVVKQTASSSVALYVKTAELDDIPSFSFLDDKDFPVHLVDASNVLPSEFVTKSPVPANDVLGEGPPVMGLQVTFIEGGLILGLAVTHQLCDGLGCENFLTGLAQHSAAVTRKTTFVITESIPDRATLTAKSKTSPDQWELLAAKFPTFKAPNEPAAPPPADANTPVVRTRIWHIPKSRLQCLKAVCSEGKSYGSWISSYDAILALTWRTVVRAKVPLLRPEPTAPSKAIHAVNARGRMQPPLSRRYIGSAVTLPQSKVLSLSDVLADGSLPLLARTVRDATNSITPSYISDLLQWTGGCRDLRWTELDMHWVLGLDCMAFDWHTMNSYHTHDYGFGTPRALRWPHPQFEGFLFVLPTRAGVKQNSDDEGIEICLGLEESCYSRLQVDKEWLGYAEERGL